MFATFPDMLREKGIEVAVTYAKGCGFSGVEFFYSTGPQTPFPSEKEIIIYKNILNKERIEAPCISCCVSLVRDDSPYEVDEDAVRFLCKRVRLAYELGAPYVHHTLYFRMKRGLDSERLMAACLEGAKRVAEYAGGLGVAILYEPQGFYFNGMCGFSKFYDSIKALTPNVGICADIGNTYWVDEEPYELLQKYASDIKHVHIKDYVMGGDSTQDKTRGGTPISEVEIGCGVVELARFAEILKSVDYQGYISLEDNSPAPHAEKTARTMSLLNKLF